MSDLEARIAEVAKAHRTGATNSVQSLCMCDLKWRSLANHDTHVANALAAMLAPVIAEAKAEALRGAADELAPKGILWWGDSGVRVSDGPFGMPQGSLDDWLRTRADNLEKP